MTIWKSAALITAYKFLHGTLEGIFEDMGSSENQASQQIFFSLIEQIAFYEIRTGKSLLK